jgi:hypothetical protein
MTASFQQQQLRTFSYIHDNTSYRITIPDFVNTNSNDNSNNNNNNNSNNNGINGHCHSDMSYQDTPRPPLHDNHNGTINNGNNNAMCHTSLVPIPQLEVFNSLRQRWEIATMTTITTKTKRRRRSVSMDATSTKHRSNEEQDEQKINQQQLTTFQRAFRVFQRVSQQGAKESHNSHMNKRMMAGKSRSTPAIVPKPGNNKNNNNNNREQKQYRNSLSFHPTHLIQTTSNNDIFRWKRKETVKSRHPLSTLPEDTIYYILSFLETKFDQYSNFDLNVLYGRFTTDCTLRFLHPNIALNSNIRYLYGKKRGFQKGTMRILMRNVICLKFYGSRMTRFLLQFFNNLQADGIEMPLLKSIKLPMHVTSTFVFKPVVGVVTVNGAVIVGTTTAGGLMPPAPAIGGTAINAAANQDGDTLLDLTPVYDLMILQDTATTTTTVAAAPENNKKSAPFRYKKLLVNMQLLSLSGTKLNDYYGYFDNILDLRIRLEQDDKLTLNNVQTIMKTGKLRRLRIESQFPVDAPPGFFKYLLTITDENEEEEDGSDDETNYDTNRVVTRKSSSLQVLELENIYLTGSVLTGIDSNTTLHYLSIRYTCNPHHMFILGRRDAVLLNRNRSLMFLTGDLSLTPEFLALFSSTTLRVLQLSPKFVPNVVSTSQHIGVTLPTVSPFSQNSNPLTSVIAMGTVSNLVNGLLNGKGLLYTMHDQRIALSQFLKFPCLTELYIHCDQIDFGSNGLEESVLALRNHPNLKRVILYASNDTVIGNAYVHVENSNIVIPSSSNASINNNTNTTGLDPNTTANNNIANSSATIAGEQQSPLIYLNTNIQKVQVICALLNHMLPSIEFLLYNPQENNSLGNMEWW